MTQLFSFLHAQNKSTNNFRYSYKPDIVEKVSKVSLSRLHQLRSGASHFVSWNIERLQRLEKEKS